MEFIDGLFAGGIIGVVLGIGFAWSQKQQRVLRAALEEDMIREIKRRRFEAALERNAAREVETELNDSMPWCESCRSYHAPTAPGCFKLREQKKE